MKRREFLSLAATAGAVAAFPRVAFGQQGKMKRLGYLANGVEGDPVTIADRAAFWDGMGRHGWHEADLTVNYRWNASTADQALTLGTELVALKPDVLFATTTPPTNALTSLTKTIPIVFAYVSGTTIAPLVQNYAHPEGNITGFQYAPNEEYVGKAIDLLKQFIPGVRGLATLYNPDAVPGGETTFLSAFVNLSAEAKLRLVPYPVKTPAELSDALKNIANDPALGLVIWGDAYFATIRPFAIAEVARYGLVAIWGQGSYTTAGGLISYGPDALPIYRGGGEYVGLILSGSKPSDLAIQTPSMVLTVSLKTAKAEGVMIPSSVLAIADQLIE